MHLRMQKSGFGARIIAGGLFVTFRMHLQTEAGLWWTFHGPGGRGLK
jgi:hypothetical protein